MSDPLVEVDGHTTVELDARDARALDVTTHRATDDSGKGLLSYRLVDGKYNPTVSARHDGYVDDVAAPDFYVLPTEQVGEVIEFEFVSVRQQRQPVLQCPGEHDTGRVERPWAPPTHGGDCGAEREAHDPRRANPGPHVRARRTTARTPR